MLNERPFDDLEQDDDSEYPYDRELDFNEDRFSTFYDIPVDQTEEFEDALA